MNNAIGEVAEESLLYKRLMLKVSGEALMGKGKSSFSLGVLEDISRQIAQIRELGAEICLVIGGGNIFRGPQGVELGIERTSGDHIGMLATVMNALALQASIERHGLETRVLSAIPMNQICEPFILRRAVRHLERGRICIFAAGTGNPFFSTDTAAVLRAIETGCEAIFKGTAVNGVYDRDPAKYPDAKRFDTINHSEVLRMNLKVMDAAAVALARDNQMPIVVYSLSRSGSLFDVVKGRGIYTTIRSV